MCGIIGISSNKSVSSSIVNSLKKLEYRGYDSAGIATLANGHINEIKSEGSDVTVVSFGKILKEVFKASEKLKEQNINIEIIDLRTVRPLDISTIIESVKKTNRLVILEEAWPFGNVSTEISYQVQNKALDYLDAPIIKINTADTPTPYSPVLLKEWLPNHNDVIKAVNKVLYK